MVNGWLCSILRGWEMMNTVPLLIPSLSVQTGTSVSVGIILSFHLGHTYCQFRLYT